MREFLGTMKGVFIAMVGGLTIVACVVGVAVGVLWLGFLAFTIHTVSEWGSLFFIIWLVGSCFVHDLRKGDLYD